MPASDDKQPRVTSAGSGLSTVLLCGLARIDLGSPTASLPSLGGIVWEKARTARFAVLRGTPKPGLAAFCLPASQVRCTSCTNSIGAANIIGGS